MDASATHMPMVVAMVIKSGGPILEMGCGPYSTYILHEICKLTKRELVTLDGLAGWLDEYLFLASNFHSLYFVKDWAAYTLIDAKRWGMVLIDHAPEDRRKIDIDRLKDNADYLIVHDTNVAGYGYEPILDKFKYRFDYKIVIPWTTVVSNVKDLSFLQDGKR